MTSHRAALSLLASSCLALTLLACGSSGDSSSTGSPSSGTGGTGGSSSSSMTSSGGSGGGGASGGTCPITGLCDVITLSDVNATCGLAATDTKPSGAATPGGDTVSSCGYTDVSGTLATTGKACIVGLDPDQFYQDQHDSMLKPTEMQEDLSGVGSKAYFRSDATNHHAEIVALQGSVVASAESDAATDIAATKTCLIALAKEILASP